jgi:hypothetical protein
LVEHRCCAFSEARTRTHPFATQVYLYDALLLWLGNYSRVLLQGG